MNPLALQNVRALASAVVAFAASCDGADKPLLLDERAGTFRGVGLGSSTTDVRREFGKPGKGEGFFPLEDDVRGPYAFPIPGGGQPFVLRYEHVAFALTGDRVFGFIVSDRRAVTRRGVGVGDRLNDAREAYPNLTCQAYAGEAIIGDNPTYTLCRSELGRGRILSFEEDRIRSITLLDLSR